MSREYAIRTPDGELDMAYDEYVGQHVAVYTDRSAAEFRRDQIRSAGYRFKDHNLIGAEVIYRDVPDWSTAEALS